MHYRLFVTFNKSEAKNSEEARAYANRELENDTSFVGEGGRFGSSVADWFVIGGRWSGAITQALLPKAKMKKFWKEFEEQKLGWTGLENTEEKQREKTRVLFTKYFPNFKGELPIYRDNYKDGGYEDDGMIVTKEIYNNILKEYEGKTEEEGEFHTFSFLDLDYEAVCKDFIGKKWIVVVDYHN